MTDVPFLAIPAEIGGVAFRLQARLLVEPFPGIILRLVRNLRLPPVRTLAREMPGVRSERRYLVMVNTPLSVHESLCTSKLILQRYAKILIRPNIRINIPLCNTTRIMPMNKMYGKTLTTPILTYPTLFACTFNIVTKKYIP